MNQHIKKIFTVLIVALPLIATAQNTKKQPAKIPAAKTPAAKSQVVQTEIKTPTPPLTAIDSLQQINAAILLKPSYELSIKRAAILARLGDYSGAILNYTDAIQLNNTEKSAYYERGNAQYAVGEVKGSLADFDKAIELDSLMPEYYLKRGITKRTLKNYIGALADFDKAIELKPDYSEAFNNRGLCKFYTDDELNVTAINDIDKAIELNPNYAEAYNNKGDYFINEENDSAACASWTKAAELGNAKAKKSIDKYCIPKMEENKLIIEPEKQIEPSPNIQEQPIEKITSTKIDSLIENTSPKSEQILNENTQEIKKVELKPGPPVLLKDINQEIKKEEAKSSVQDSIVMPPKEKPTPAATDKKEDKETKKDKPDAPKE
jgi:tetratricopeptide (TPR) repeat protein